MHRRARWASSFAITALVVAVSFAAAPQAAAVDTDLSISTTSIDFGEVDVGTTAGPTSVTLTNGGGDPFGPINIFGGAPPTNEFNASQNCQGTTLPAGGSCSVSYTFTPGAQGTFNDSSNFTVSETSNQNDGEDFAVALTGVGFDPNASTTTTTSTTSTSSTTTTTTAPTTTTKAGTGSGTASTGTTPTTAGNQFSAPPTTVAPRAVAQGEDDDPDGLVIALIALIVLLAIGGLAFEIANRRNRRARSQADTTPPP